MRRIQSKREKEPDKFTHQELIAAGWHVAKYIAGECPPVRPISLRETYEPALTGLPEIPDVFAISDGKGLDELSVLVECKTSYADFRKDEKKPFRVYPDKGVGKYRAYVAPFGVIDPALIPEKWLLFEVFDDGAIFCVKGFLDYHRRSIDPAFRERNFEAELILYRYMRHWEDKGYPPKVPHDLDRFHVVWDDGEEYNRRKNEARRF